MNSTATKKAKRNWNLMAIALGLMVAGCGDKREEQPGSGQDDAVPEISEVPRPELPSGFEETYSELLDQYFVLTEILTESDAEKAAREAGNLLEVLERIDANHLDSGIVDFWSGHADEIRQRAEAMTEKDDVDEQRYDFEYLSLSMIACADRLGTAGKSAYVQRCPMVRGGSADWLSREPEIRNPYHGDRMMNCGTTVSEL